MSRPASAPPGDSEMEREFPDLYRRIVLGITERAIFAVDRTGRVMSWNAGAESIVGYTRAEAIGRPVSLLYRLEDIAAGEPDRLLQEAASAGRAEEEGWRVRKNGEQFRQASPSPRSPTMTASR